ncbi:hypothetical protein BDZ97DRAFT_1877522 [Flammula alnicola]|nr:hypothetical protein BDZ97DRAFT_1877522 [Flammula alnicola]
MPFLIFLAGQSLEYLTTVAASLGHPSSERLEAQAVDTVALCDTERVYTAFVEVCSAADFTAGTVVVVLALRLHETCDTEHHEEQFDV